VLPDDTGQLQAPSASAATLNYRNPKTGQSIAPLFSPRTRRLMTAALVLLFCWCGYWVWSRTIAQNRWRIEREHGLALPASAANFVCEGSGWFILDRAAVARFDIATTDLPAFMQQLKPDPGFPSSFGYTEGNGIIKYYCQSPTGDGLLVTTRPLGATRVFVTLGTDWN
jgi:hypothetical protein